MRRAIFVSLIWVIGSMFLLAGGAMYIKSPAFKNGGKIPAKYGCHGKDISIPLEFGNIPKGAKSLALIMEDPDAPGGLFVHWLLYNIPSTLRGLPEGIAPSSVLKSGMRQGINDFGKIGYGGPCPPDRAHRYFIRLYALDRAMPLRAGIDRKRLLNEMRGHILQKAEIMGIYPSY